MTRAQRHPTQLVLLKFILTAAQNLGDAWEAFYKRGIEKEIT
jgi:hypothetical protein